METKVRDYFVLKGKFNWSELDKILGKSEYGITGKDEPKERPCGLAPGKLTYKIYYTWNRLGGCSAHVCRHADGICFSGSLNIDIDWDYAKELYEKVKDRYPK